MKNNVYPSVETTSEFPFNEIKVRVTKIDRSLSAEEEVRKTKWQAYKFSSGWLDQILA